MPFLPPSQQRQSTEGVNLFVHLITSLFIFKGIWVCSFHAFSALTLLVGRWEEHPA